jgi:hypothetical protein
MGDLRLANQAAVRQAHPWVSPQITAHPGTSRARLKLSQKVLEPLFSMRSESYPKEVLFQRHLASGMEPQESLTE